MVVNSQFNKVENFSVLIKGSKRAISTSKIKKIIVIKKKEKEKGFRGKEIKLNPHSKEFIFSLLNLIFLARIVDKFIIIRGITINNHLVINIIIISYSL